MPSFMKTLSHFSPVKWSILSLEGAIWRGFTMSEMLLPCGALVLTGAVCLVTGTAVLSRAAE
jgi:ABC-2 type transport system permease protein